MRVLILTLCLCFLAFPVFAQDNAAYERIEKSGKIRCGYAVWNPSLMKDPNTGEFSGIFYEYMEALGQALGLEIEWAEQIGWGDFPAALKSGRIDVMCAGVWPNSKRARHVDFVQPIYYLPFLAYVRADDTRFDSNIAMLNGSEYTLTMTDGESSAAISYSDFPNAKKVELPQISEISQNFLNVVNGKADAYLNDVISFYEFDKNNPGKLKVIPSERPIRTFGNTIAVDSSEQRLRRMLKNATLELLSNGTIEKILSKYENHPDSLYRVDNPYKAP